MIADLSKKPELEPRRTLRFTKENQQSEINNHQSTIALDALALAADQDAGHGVGGVAGLGQGCVGAVPAGVVDVVSGGTAFAVTALAAGAAVQDDFAWAGGPVFVDEKFRGFGGGSGGLGDQSDFGGDFLQAGARAAAHGQQRAAVEFLGL